MDKPKLLWISKTTLFFAVVGSLIGTVFVFSIWVVNLPFITQKGFLYPVAIFLMGYLFGIFVAAFSGLLYSIAIVLTQSLSTTSLTRKLACALVAGSSLVAMYFVMVYGQDFGLSKMFWSLTNQDAPKYAFLIICTMLTAYLHSLAENAYQFFAPTLQAPNHPLH